AALAAAYDLVLDATDDFPTRYLLNDVCYAAGKPLVQGAVGGYWGQAAVYASPGPCYRCLYPEAPPAAAPACDGGAVLGPVPAVVSGLMATLALNRLLGLGAPDTGRLWWFDARSLEWTGLAFGRRAGCDHGRSSAVAPVRASAREEEPRWPGAAFS
ncbi:MAG: ThiF family adenylyltransferase, partial [Firmicutes bacterium]|nr:ThiF family adenylyltransferase [Bacillota bacterium]